MPRGQGERCVGFSSDVPGLAFCSRVEAGSLKTVDSTAGPIYLHRIADAVPLEPTASEKPGKKRVARGHRTPQDAARGLGARLGKLTGSWTYPDANGLACLIVFRFDSESGSKAYRPVGRHPDGQWRVGDPPGALPLFGLPELVGAGRVFVVEGEKSAAAIRSLGLVATTSAHGAGAARKSDWSPLARVELVFLWPDNDGPGEGYIGEVQGIVDTFGQRPEVRVFRPGGMPTGGDAADWVEAARAAGKSNAEIRDELLRLVDSEAVIVPRPDDTDSAPARPNEAPDDPHRLARLFRDRRCSHPDGVTLRFYRDEWQRWDGTAYRQKPTSEIKAEVAAEVKDEFDRINLAELALLAKLGAARGKLAPTARRVTAALVNNVLLAMSGYMLLESSIESPAWLGSDDPLFDMRDVLPARNCAVHLPGLVENKPGSIIPCTPRFFTPWALSYDFDSTAARPSRWLAFLASIWPDDPQSIETLQEWFGYSLTPDTRQQKIGALIGPRRSGKGTIARVLRAAIGSDNVAGPTLSGLASNFGLAPLIGKPVAIIDDARISGRADAAVIVERLLTISGEGALTVDRKHLPAWTGKLSTRVLLLSNELPRLADSSGALAGRLVLLQMTRSFYGREDPKLTDDLLQELPGILLWAIEGWRRLRERGHFVQPDSGRELIEEMQDLSSPIAAFLRERCDLGPGFEILASDLFAHWKAWSEAAGRKSAGDVMSFGRDLRAAIPNLKSVQRRENDRARSYIGITTKPDTSVERHAVSRVNSYCSA